MITLKEKTRYQELLSPEAVSQMPHPEKSKALIDDRMVPEEEAWQKIAEVCLNARKPVIFTPGRIILWTWEEGAPEKARVLRKLAAAIGAEILPIMDIRPDYPQMRTAVEINPYHGDLVIGHNRYDVAVFMAVDCPYADVALKIIKDGTHIYTIALCGHLGHVDARITLCQTGLDKVEKLIEVINKMKEERQSNGG
ncbi:MAG TPA: carbon monoxide dehydrogenase [Dehalococcoidia bacterium]|nr:carbon monoxide dehydrogenase [Dehalococcoidia bacterium]